MGTSILVHKLTVASIYQRRNDMIPPMVRVIVKPRNLRLFAADTYMQSICCNYYNKLSYRAIIGTTRRSM